MAFNSATMTQARNAMLVISTVSLVGCGGSGGSSSSTPVSSGNATLKTNIGYARGGYSVMVARDGTATYIVNEVGPGQPPSVSGSGTVPAALTSQFFSNLDAVALTYQPPSGVGGGSSSGSSSVSYAGKTITVGSSSDIHMQALYDEYNSIVKVLNVPTLPQY